MFGWFVEAIKLEVHCLFSNPKLFFLTFAKLVMFRINTFETSMLYLCATMWHETYDEMMNIIISIFR